MQLPGRIMGAWNEGCRYISMATYSLLPHCVLSCACRFSFPCCHLKGSVFIWVPSWITHRSFQSNQFGFDHRNSPFLPLCLHCHFSHRCVRSVWINPGISPPGLHILCSELDWKPLLPGWTEKLKIHASAAGEGTPLWAPLQQQGRGRSPGPALPPWVMPNSSSQADVATEHPCQGGVWSIPAPWSWDAAMGN